MHCIRTFIGVLYTGVMIETSGSLFGADLASEFMGAVTVCELYGTNHAIEVRAQEQYDPLDT
jgi:hypothetical protein